MDDPHVVALAVMTWHSHTHCDIQNSERAQIAIVFMAVAGFYKHSLIAIPMAAIFRLTLHDRRRGLRATLIGLGTVGFGLAVCGVIFGPAFFHDMLLPRVHHPTRGIGHIGLTQFIAPSMIVAVVWACYRLQTFRGRFVMLFTCAALVAYMVESTAEGVYENSIFFELIVAAAIGLGCAFGDLEIIPRVRSWGLERTQVLIVCILIVRLLLSQHLTPYLLLFSPDFRAGLSERVAKS
jgi:hypothetical protein